MVFAVAGNPMGEGHRRSFSPEMRSTGPLMRSTGMPAASTALRFSRLFPWQY